MRRKLQTLFNLIISGADDHTRFMDTYRNLSAEDLASCPPVIGYNALNHLSDHIFKEARRKNAYYRDENTGAIIINESSFSQEIELGKKLCDATALSSSLYEKAISCAEDTALWLAENRPRILLSNCQDELKSFIQEMVAVQCAAFSFEGLAFKTPDINIIHDTKTKSLGWTFFTDVRNTDFTVPDIFINRGLYEEECKDDIFMTAFHECMHTLLVQVAHHLETGGITKSSDIYKDAVSLITKYDVGYTASTLIRSLYYNDPEEKLVHQAHKAFIESSRSMPAALKPLLLRTPVNKPH